jgi:hypothetical protein
MIRVFFYYHDEITAIFRNIVRWQGENKAEMGSICAVKTMHRCFFVAE